MALIKKNVYAADPNTFQIFLTFYKVVTDRGKKQFVVEVGIVIVFVVIIVVVVVVFGVVVVVIVIFR